MTPELLAQADAIDLPALLSSIPGIASVTLVLVALLRRAVAGVPVAKDVPVWVYAVAVSLGLSLLAVVMRWMDAPEGGWREYVEFGLRVGIQAAVASGVREWFKKMSVTPAKMSGVALLASCLILTGCGATAGERLVSAHNTYQQANRSIAVAVDLDVLTLEQAEQALVVSEQAGVELRAATEAYLAGQTLDLKFALLRLQSRLDELIQIHLRTQQAQSGASP